MITNICVVGVGKIFQLYHLRSIQSTNKIKIKYVVDKNFELATKIAKKIGAAPIKNLEEKIDCKNFFITVPPQFRIQIFDNIKEYAKNIVFEKPVTLTHKEALYINDYAVKKDINVLVAQTRRFFPNLVFTKGVLSVTTGSKIKIKAFEGALFNWSSESNYFNNNNPNDHGIFHDVGSHIFDYIIFFVESIYDIKKLKIKVFKSKFDSEQNSNNTYSSLKMYDEDVEFNIEVRLSRSSNLSNMIFIKEHDNLGYMTRSLMARDIKILIKNKPITIPVPEISSSFDLDDVFYNMWLDIERVMVNNSTEKSRITLKSILNTTNLMQNLIDVMQVDDKLNK